MFDSTLVALGVCLPKKAKAFNYRKLIDSSHGGFLIGNNGKCYHSTDMNYEKKDLSVNYNFKFSLVSNKER